MQAVEILPKISVFKQYFLRKQELVFCVRDTVTLLLSGIFLHPIAARLSKCPPFFWDGNFDDIHSNARYLWYCL